MRVCGFRSILTAASALAITTGVAIADDGNGNGGNRAGLGVSIGGGSGLGVSLGGGSGISASVGGSSGISASVGGESGAGASLGASSSAGGNVGDGTGASASLGVGASIGGSEGDDDEGTGAVGSAPPPEDTDAPPAAAPNGDGPRPDAVPADTVSAPQREPTFSNEDLVASIPPIPQWRLADFSGKRVRDAGGTGIGTVEGVVVDAANNLYLMTALDSQDVDGQERLIPLNRFEVDAPSQSLVLDSDAVARLPMMADMATVASAFMMVDSDAKLQALLTASR